MAIGGERTEVEPPTMSKYRSESGELYAEDVDQHMAILPGVVTPASEISLDDIQVGDPREPLLSDQEKLRQVIWANRHLLIGKGNALPPAAREQSVILMSETLTRSHKACDRSHPSFARS